MTEHEMRNRAREFSGPILDAGRDNPVIFSIINAYVTGRIVTREEALSQMVVLLAKDWDAYRQAAFNMAMRSQNPMGVPT